MVKLWYFLRIHTLIVDSSLFWLKDLLVKYCFPGQFQGPGPNSRVVYIDGAFDLFHAGHVQVLLKLYFSELYFQLDVAFVQLNSLNYGEHLHLAPDDNRKELMN